MNFFNFYLGIRAIPKTVYFNLKYFRFKDAIKFPVLVSHRVVLSKMKGSVEISAPLKTAMIRIGFGKVRIFDQRRMRAVWHLEGSMVFKGSASLGNGTKLSVLGNLTMGNNFIVSAHSQIECRKRIVFGDDVLIGWDCLFMDTDGHHILKDGRKINQNKDIIVGDRVWFGCRTTITKGVIVASDIVVATNTCLYGTFLETNCIVAGNPPEIKKRDITWVG
ncbi:hypothetical protein M3647_04035 [Paenibacillus cellulositrophicus]|uniref:acyltransferase n=1 Tax=Paenibacillus cellulositrophicus TaxID=562959 RepID=UPI00204016E9|nr:hypothetical protein [Paenibacillus cellulositrophicus]MCM2996634.1 hypothetical protein [Paenibacillus cellulositrophicus]